jgi:molybdopterin converting factor small subunit
VADVHLPATLPPLFDQLPRQLDVDAASVGEAIAQLDARWPGLRDRLCEGGGLPGAEGMALRPHIRVFVDGERAELDAPLAAGARLDVIAAISGG